MPLALLLSPDDQAVSAITAVLEEMSVTCERPLDGASAAQKLNSNRFDIVLVDCENLPAAKLIFDVCRNRKDGSHPVPVAVVDGRAGLPTAFRLGAELILTKPVAKDQARVTIRTAISRVKKEESVQAAVVSAQESAAHAVATQENPIANAQQSFGMLSEPHADDAAELAVAQERAFAATASAGSISLTSFSDPAPTADAPSASMTMSAAVAEPEIVEADSAPEGNFASSTGNVSAAVAHLSSARSSSTGAVAKPAVATTAAIEPADKKEEKVDVPAGAKDSEGKAEAKAETVVSAAPPSAAKSSTTEQKSATKQGQKSHGRMVTLVVLLVTCGAFYAAWVYKPGFQALAKSQINHFLVVVGMAPQPQPAAPAPVRPAAPTAKPSAGVPALTSTPDAAQPSQPAGTGSNAAPGASSSPAASSLATSTPTSPALSTHPAAPTGAQPASSAAVQPTPAAAGAGQPASTAANTGAKSGVTRIDLSPSAFAEPAPKTVKHAPPASTATPPQN
jgi:DNA-binding NarL/FixJ family response regulator